MQMADDEESPFEPRKILVRDLAPNTTQDYLNRYFTQFADAVESIIPHNSITGSPHSFGFVVFKYQAASRIPFILQLPHCIHDRCVEVSRALKGEDLQTLESQRKISTCHDNFERIGNFDKRKIFVQGSPRCGITNDELLRYFQGFGNVIDCFFWNDMGFGHITFRMKRDTDRVLYRRSYILNGRRLTVNILKRLPLDHNDARNPNVSRAIIIQEEAAASSGSDHHANGTTRDMQPQAATSDSHVQIIAAAESSDTDHANDTRDMQPQAAESVSNTRDHIQIIPAAASFHTGHPPNNSDRNRKQRNHRRAKNMQQEAAASFGADHFDSTTDMQPQDAASVSDTIDYVQIVPAAASSGTDHLNSTTGMQPQAAASVGDTRDVQIVLAAANSDADHVDSTTDMQPQDAASVSDTRDDVQIVPAAASSGIDHVNSTTDMQPQAAASIGDTRDVQIVLAAASSDADHTDMQPQDAASVSDTRDDVQIVPAAESSGTDHVNSTQPQAAKSVSSSGDMLIIPAAAISDHRNMQNIPAAARSDHRNMQNIPAAASSRTGHPRNNSARNRRWITCSNAGHITSSSRTNLPPSDQSILHDHPRMTYMVPGVTRPRFPGHRPTLHQAYNRMGIYTTATNNFPPAGVAHQAYNGMGIYTNAAHNFPPAGALNFPRYYAGNGNFPMAPADYSNQDFNYYYYSSMSPADYNSNQDFNNYYYSSMVPADYNSNQDFNYYDNTNGYY